VIADAVVVGGRVDISVSCIAEIHQERLAQWLNRAGELRRWHTGTFLNLTFDLIQMDELCEGEK
jgi:hypothetical protein